MNTEERLLEAWVGLTCLFKNNRMTTGLTYNEATVLMYAYFAYQKGEKEISLQSILKKTKMKKSLLNRTVDALVKKNLIMRQKGQSDGRTIFISIVESQLNTFIKVHDESLSIVRHVIDLIGEEDAEAVIRVYEKLANEQMIVF